MCQLLVAAYGTANSAETCRRPLYFPLATLGQAQIPGPETKDFRAPIAIQILNPFTQHAERGSEKVFCTLETETDVSAP